MAVTEGGTRHQKGVRDTTGFIQARVVGYGDGGVDLRRDSDSTEHPNRSLSEVSDRL